MDKSEYLVTMRRMFLPCHAKIIDGLPKEDRLFVHYTSAENGINIIKNKEIWLRNVRCMNDFSEVEHGMSVLQSYYFQ